MVHASIILNPFQCILSIEKITVFLLIMKRDRDRRVQKRPHKKHRQCDSLSLRSSLSILVRTLMDATVTVTFQNQKKH
jgi:hypothetical protein